MFRKKKLFATTAVAVLILCSLSSCNKDDEPVDFVNIDGIEVKVVNEGTFSKNETNPSWLYFRTKADYEHAIDYLSQGGDSVLYDFEQSLSFKSMRCSMKNEDMEAIGIEDDLLATAAGE